MAIVGATMQIAFWSIVLPTVLWILIKLFGDLFYGIGTMLFSVMDLLQSTFRKLAGLGTVWVDGEPTGDILTAIMKSDIVVDVLISVAVFALGLVILGSIVQVIRLEYTTEGSKNSKEKVFTSALKSLLMMVLIPIVCFVGIRLSNYLLQAVDYATSSSGASTVSGSVFVASTVEASKVYDDKNQTVGANINDLLGSMFLGADYTNAIVTYNGSQWEIKHFEDKFKVTGTSGEDNEKKARIKLTQMVGQSFIQAKQNDYMFEVGTSLPAGVSSSTILKVWDKLSYTNVDAVSYFYNTGNINYLLLFVGCYICIKALFSASMGMIARLYKVVGLFVIAPAAIGLQPIDDGGAYKKWRSSFIQNVLSCYGFIVALNLYFMVVGVLQTVELWEGVLFYLPNSFMQFLFVLTGATMIKDLSSLFGGLIGAADAMADGEKATSAVGQMAGSVAKVGMGAAMGGAAAFKGIGAAINKYQGTRLEKGSDGKLHFRGSVAGEEAAARRGEDLKKTYNVDEKGNITGRKDGKAMSAKEIKRKTDMEGKIKDGESATKNMRTDKDLAERSAIAAQLQAESGMLGNRFKTMVGDSGLGKNFKNLTGNIGSYVSGKAYKGVDTDYFEALEKDGVDDTVLKGLKEQIGTTGTSRIGKKTRRIRTTSERLNSAATPANVYTEDQSYISTNEKANEQLAADVKEENSGLVAENRANDMKKRANLAEIQKLQNSNKRKTTAVDGSGTTVNYQTVSATESDDIKAFRDAIREFISGISTGSELRTAASTFAGTGISGVGPAKDMLTTIEHIMTDPNINDNEARRLLSNNATVNISEADLTAQLHDEKNKANISIFGTYQERQQVQSDIARMNEENRSLTEANAENTEKMRANRKAVADRKQVVEDYKNGIKTREEVDSDSKAIEEALKQANKDLVDAIKALNDKSKNQKLKVEFPTDQKFKIADEPILAALTKVKEAIDAEAKAKKGATDAGAETNKLLKEMIKKMK